MSEERPVQHRSCPECGTAQQRRQGSDGKFKRWSKCACPPKKKSGDHDGEARSGNPGAASATAEATEATTSGPVAGDEQTGLSAPSPAPGYLYRDHVTPIPKGGK